MGVLRNRDARRLLTAGVVSALGSCLLLVAAPVQVYRLTGSALAAGSTLAVEALPAVVVGPWAGALVDRWDRRRVLLVSDVLAAGGVAVLALATSPARVPLVYVGLLVENLAVVFHRPAARAALPSIVDDESDLASANGLSAFGTGIVRLAGPPLGTLLLAAGGLRLVVGLDAASYAASAALVAGLAARPGPGVPDRRRIAAELREGWRILVGTPELRGLLVSSWVFWTANAALTALLVPFVVDRLGLPGRDVGYLFGALGVGYVVGSLPARRIVPRYPPRAVLTAAYLCVGLCFAVLFTATAPAVAVGAIALAGVPGALAMVTTQHRLQTATPGPVLGRVGAAFYASDAVATLTGALLAPALVSAASLPGALDALTGLVLLAAATAAVLMA